MYVLDTNVVSELRGGRPQASPRVATWAASVPASTLYLSAVTVLELERGVLLLERKTPPQGSVLRRWLDGLLAGFEGRLLAFSAEAALACARMHVPHPKSERDAMIAATALVHGFCVVTRNTGDFAGLDVPLFNPWELSVHEPAPPPWRGGPLRGPRPAAPASCTSAPRKSV